MEKSGLYNRQGILTRKPKRVVDKNYTFQNYEESKAKQVAEFKKSKKDTYHDFLKVHNFGVKDEKINKQKLFKQEADLQLKLRQELKAEQDRKNKMEDRQMLTHLQQQLKREAKHNMAKKKNLQKVSVENKNTSVFHKNVTKLNNIEDNMVDKTKALSHQMGYKVTFY